MIGSQFEASLDKILESLSEQKVNQSWWFTSVTPGRLGVEVRGSCFKAGKPQDSI
jgi:hypothetical protein